MYRQKEPATLIRIVGQAPLEATVFEMERLRCNGCGEVFTAGEPPSAGPAKFDATAVVMIALLKYGTGMPFNRMERLEGQLGIPLPATTQWELMEAAAKSLKPVLDELIRQAAQGGVMHNDDTGMRILQMARGRDDGRTGTFTTGIVSICGGWKIALYFSGWKHAGENLADVLKQRAPGLAPPIQMCDALSRNSPKLIETLLANCLAHGRRQFTEVADSFPDECRYVPESLGAVYGFDADAKERGLTPKERLTFHQTHSAPVMEDLRRWMENQFAEHKTEPNSGLGKAISYLLRHWAKLTLFLRQQGAPLDNNIVERALKKAVLHRKNALFYKTMNGARVGDLFMSLIHTCELNKVNPFDYLTELLRHPAEVTVASGGVDAMELQARAQPPWPRNIMVQSDGRKDRLRPCQGESSECPQNGLPAKRNQRTFSASHEDRRKCCGPACMRVCPRTINRLCRCRFARLREYAARRGWTVATQVREVSSGAVERKAREQLHGGRAPP